MRDRRKSAETSCLPSRPSVSAMLTLPLLLLLLLLRVLLASTAPAIQQQDCIGPTYPETAVTPPQCSTVPCATATTQSLTLALPVLLTLYPAVHARSGWSMSAQVLDQAGRRLGQAALDSEDDDVTMIGWVCDVFNKGEASIPRDHLQGILSLHLAAAVQEGHLSLTYVLGSRNTTALTLHFPHHHLPATIRLTSATHTRYGYSPLTATTTTTVTTTTASQAVVVSVSSLVGVGVVVSVGVLVLACRGWVEAEALLGTVLA